MAEEKQEKLKFAYIPCDLIDISISNVRKSNLEEGIDELANSIREIGVQQPVTVFKKGERYELIIGQRRYLACHKAGITEIPAVITKVTDRTQGIIKSFSENIHRRDLAYHDKMQAALELLEKLKSIDNVAKCLGVSSQTIRNYLGYAAVPEEIKSMVADKKFSASFAMRIVRGIPDEKLAIDVAHKIADTPRSTQRNLLIDVAIENPQEKKIEKLVDIAKKTERMRKIIIYVTERVYQAICKAAKEYESDSQMIVKEAVENWLSERNFIK